MASQLLGREHSGMRSGLIIAALLLTAASPPPTADDIGPEPAFPEAVAMTEQAVRAQLIDPGHKKRGA